LQRIAQSGVLPPGAQVCVEGTEEWRPLADLFPNSPRPTKVIPITPTTLNQRKASRLPLILAIVALALSATTAAKVFWPRAKYSFKTPLESIHSMIALANSGSWEDFRDIQWRKARSDGGWSYELLDKSNVELHKTIEVTGSGDKEMNGRVICFLRLKCPDGVTRYSTVVFQKDKKGDFVQSRYPSYSLDEKLTPEDQRFTELMKRWETTGELVE
jgi:hypothetical protein